MTHYRETIEKEWESSHPPPSQKLGGVFPSGSSSFQVLFNGFLLSSHFDGACFQVVSAAGPTRQEYRRPRLARMAPPPYGKNAADPARRESRRPSSYRLVTFCNVIQSRGLDGRWFISAKSRCSTQCIKNRDTFIGP